MGTISCTWILYVVAEFVLTTNNVSQGEWNGDKCYSLGSGQHTTQRWKSWKITHANSCSSVWIIYIDVYHSEWKSRSYTVEWCTGQWRKTLAPGEIQHYNLEPYQTSTLTAKITLSAYFSSLFGSYPSPYKIHGAQVSYVCIPNWATVTE